MSDDDARLTVRLIMEAPSRNDVYPPEVLDAIERIADIAGPALDADGLAADPRALEDVDVLLTGWGAPPIDAALLARAPRVRAVLHAAGTIKHLITDAAWDRGIEVSTAAAVNADPVAEVAAAQIVLAARGVPASRRVYRQRRDLTATTSASGATGRTVGLLSLGEIGRRVADRLHGTAFTLIAHDPFVDPAQAARLGIELVSLDELFERSDVVSLHAPLLPSTTGMIDAALLERMPVGATLINTARGGLIDEADLAEVFGRRDDLTALLDVTAEEPLAPESPLWMLENIELTPHVAGSMGADRAAMGQLVADELGRLARGLPLAHRVDRAQLERLA